MAISQNARFSGKAAATIEFEHPPGESIAKILRDALAELGWQVSDIENWRDLGWSIACRRPASTLELVITNLTAREE